MSEFEDLNKTFVFFPDAKTVALATNGAERLRIDPFGNVGIGKIPQDNAKLDVNGTIKAAGLELGSDTTTTEGNVIKGATSDSSAFALTIKNSDNSKLLSVRNDGNIGIGVENPEEKLHVNGAIKGNQAGALRINTGYGYVDIGPKNASWSHFETDRSQFYFNKGIHVNSGLIGSYDENLFLHTGGTTRLTIRHSDGNVGIGTNPSGYKLEVAGPIHATNFPATSDLRFKTDIVQLTNVLDKIERIRGVSFQWNELHKSLFQSTERQEIGIIAQEIESVFPEVVSTWGDENFKAIDYSRLISVVIEAIKELKAEIKELYKKIDGKYPNSFK